VITGTPTDATPTGDYVVTASSSTGGSQKTLSIQVTPALPSGMIALQAGFEAQIWQPGLSAPVKLDFAADGRLFFNELSNGNIRVIDAGGNLLPTAFATVTVLHGAEQGLLGLELDPNFGTNGFVYVFASVPAGGGHGDRNQVLRFTASGNVASGPPTVIVDDLPTNDVHNSGDVKIGPDGNLYVTLGDAGTATNAQTNGVRPGRVLRYTAAGAIPGDNPIASDPEWCRGLRNSFDMTFHPSTGGLFATENGPASQDELNFIQKGKNFEWPCEPCGIAGASVGHRITMWTPVVVPTGLTFHDGTQFGAAFANNLFICTYGDTDLRRITLSGVGFTDLDEETVFARWSDPGSVANKPLDVVEGSDGSLYVSTFSAIWKIKKSP
jgi:glucose/arabinose dehydrogenase